MFTDAATDAVRVAIDPLIFGGVASDFITKNEKNSSAVFL